MLCHAMIPSYALAHVAHGIAFRQLVQVIDLGLGELRIHQP
jgi:hypothetical protein